MRMSRIKLTWKDIKVVNIHLHLINIRKSNKLLITIENKNYNTKKLLLKLNLHIIK